MSNYEKLFKDSFKEAAETSGWYVQKGVRYAWKAGYRELPYFQGAAKGAVKQGVKGVGVLKNVLADIIVDKILDSIEGERKEVFLLSDIPYAGKILFRYGEAGEVITNDGSIYVGGKYEGKLNNYKIVEPERKKK